MRWWMERKICWWLHTRYHFKAWKGGASGGAVLNTFCAKCQHQFDYTLT